MREHVTTRTTESRRTKRGLSVGYRDGRRNELREGARGLESGRVRRGLLRSASAEDWAACDRVWSEVRRRLRDGGTRADRVAAAREALESGALDTPEALDACADALLRDGEPTDR